MLLKGKFSGHLGITKIDHQGNSLFATDKERTLIDCTVRPAFAGGILLLHQAFHNARHQVSAEKIFTYLKRLDFIYPYHQSIGYYLQQAGFPEKDLTLFRQLPKPIRFYLDYEMKKPVLNKEWNLYV